MPVEVGNIVEGKVSGITGFGAFVELPDGKTGLVHISEVSDEYVRDINSHLKENQTVKVKVLSVDSNGKVSLSIRKASENERRKEPETRRDREVVKDLSFEDRLAKFLKDSDERLLDLKRNTESKRGGRGGRRSFWA
jgi:S1 RNA binding domain protein